MTGSQPHLDRLADLTYARGRVALNAILQALGVGQEDEVALQAFTCVAVPEAILAAGARPLYIDIEADGLNIDAGDLAAKLSPRTRVIVVQHTFGIPARMDRVLQVARSQGLPVVEDCCHTLASTYQGTPVGRFGVASFYSWEWGKPIVVGIGGSAVANDRLLHDRLVEQHQSLQRPPAARLLRLQLQYLAHRLLYRPRLYWPARALYRWLGSMGAAERNYSPVAEGRPTGDFSQLMAPALRRRLRRKLRLLARQTRHSNRVAGAYAAGIDGELVQHAALPDGGEPVYARYPLLTGHKPELLEQARRANVELADWYSQPVHPIEPADWQSVGYNAGSCPQAEQRCRQVVTLPTHLAVGRRDVDRAVRLCNGLVVPRQS